MNDDALFAEISEQYRRESRIGALVPMDSGFYDRCRILKDSLSVRLASCDPDSEERDAVYDRYMSVSRLITDIRRLRLDKICRMTANSVFGGSYDDSGMTDSEGEMSQSIRDAIIRCMRVG